MKFIALFLTCLITLNAIAAAPLGVKGQGDTAKQYPPVVSVPNNQATKITGGTLLETGNKNRLINPGFEHSTYFTGWSSVVTGTASVVIGPDTASPMEGARSLTIQCVGGASGGTCTVFQDFATTIALPALVYATLDSDSSTGVKLVARVNGASSTSRTLDTLNPDVVKAGVFNLGATSSGAAIEITVAASQTINVEVDEVSVQVQGLTAKLESCTDSYECEDTFSAYVSGTGVVTGENIDWISGSCRQVVVGQKDCDFKTGLFTVPPNCTATTGDASAHIASTGYITASEVYINTYDAAGVGTNTSFYLTCSKQGADYIGKTAKAVASDQNVRSIGSVGVDIQSVFFGAGASCATACSAGSCTICSRVGTKITSIDWQSTGNYYAVGINGTKYNCTFAVAAPGVTHLAAYQVAGSSTATYAHFQAGVNTATHNVYGVATCIGVP